MRNKWVYRISVLIFVPYTAWMIGPYLHSTIVRDAAVTTWLRASVSPINGKIVTELPAVGSLVGDDGHIATISNDLLLQETRIVETSRDKIILLRSKIDEVDEYLKQLRLIEQARFEAKTRHSELFHAKLETKIAGLHGRIAVNKERIAVLQRIAQRHKKLVSSGSGSRAKLDETLLRVAEMKARGTELSAKLNQVQLRDRSAESGVFINESGGTPNWLRYGELELKLEMHKASHDKHAAQTALRETLKDVKKEEQMLETLKTGHISAPPGSVVFSVRATQGATVSVGQQVVEWIDCGDLLVDVPVSDAEIPLIIRGARAEVLLEGEKQIRQATVYGTRGSAATLGSVDLAAVSKGRASGVAQVLLTLDTPLNESGECLVGRAAYVEFPDVGLIEVVRARLRF